MWVWSPWVPLSISCFAYGKISSIAQIYLLENAIALWGEPEQFSLYEVEFAAEIVGTRMTILSYAQYSVLPLW